MGGISYWKTTPRSNWRLTAIPATTIPSGKRIDHIEVLKGSGQIMYGPQTVGGAVNFVSAPIPKEFGGSLSAAGGNNGYYDTHLGMGGTVDNVGLSLDYIRQESDGNRNGQHQ